MKFIKEFKSYHQNVRQNINDLCSDVYKYAKYYTDIFFVKNLGIELRALFQDIKNIRMDVAYPFLLTLFDDYSKI